MRCNFRDRPVFSSLGLSRLPRSPLQPFPQTPTSNSILRPALQRLRTFQAKLSLSNKHHRQRKSNSDNFSISAFTVVVLDRSNFNDFLPVFGKEDTKKEDPLSLERQFFTKRSSLPLRTLRENNRATAREHRQVMEQKIIREMRVGGAREQREKTSLTNNIVSQSSFVKYNRSGRVTPHPQRLPRDSIQIQTNPKKAQTHRSPRRKLLKQTSNSNGAKQQAIQLKPWQNQLLQGQP